MTSGAGPFGRSAALRAPGPLLLVVIDLVVAVLLSAGGLVEVSALSYAAPVAVGVASCLVCTGSVAIRRRAPFVAAIAGTTALVVYQVATKDPDGSFIAPTVLLVYYTVGRVSAERRAWTNLALLLGYALVANIAISAATKPFSLFSALAGWPIMLVPAAVGIVVARHASLMRRVREATASLRDEQRVRSDRMVGEERNRVARELHDVVAHHVSVMVIQAGAARLVADKHLPTADSALEVVEQSGREALTDLRRIMGVMRRSDAPDAALSGGLANLDQILDRTRSSGVPVELRVSGRLHQVPAAVDLVAYRVVQEALTNVVKHARPATACVSINLGRHALEVVVTDDGAPREAPTASTLPGARHGLLGMRERVALYGGQLTSGVRAEGGFEVHATIPLRAEPIDAPEAHHLLVGDRVRRGWVIMVSGWWAALKPRSQLLLAATWLVALELDAFLDPYRRGPAAVNAIAVAVMAVSFVWRRRAPLLFMAVVGAAAIPLSSGLTSAHSTLVGFYGVTVATFTVAAWEAWPRAIAGLAFWTVGDISSGIVTHKPVAAVAGGLIMSCLLWAAGRLWRHQRMLAERLAETHLLLAAEREDRERLAVASERARIARELHTLVAQGVVAMIVQAAAARSSIRDDPDLVVTATSSIEQTGRAALAQMRDILGVLRSPDTSPWCDRSQDSASCTR